MCDNKKDCYDRDRMECCEKECIHDCREKCFQECYCDNNSGWGILILLIVLYLLFCNNNGKGGLFGGLF